MSVIISLASADDAPAFAQIAAQGTFAARWTAVAFADEIAQNAARVFKARADSGGIAGFIAFRFVPPAAELTNFAVAQNFLRRGAGTALLTYGLDFLRKNGVEELTLEVNVNNLAAAALYKKFNFKQTAVRKKFYNNSDDALVMKAVL
ncbi:MAG: ribosomal protein S18-alanine N-acetyltransferase [Elusimicrobiota bacterium]|jgi:ribosomal-protein-alanine N-acetyltransferase|nr:ribosomal protein S18-alanine N-acetyltransferase [Elusimicrobiota bacterium]